MSAQASENKALDNASTHSPAVLFTVKKGIGVIRLNRPQAANGLDAQLAHEFLETVIYAHEQADVRAIVLTGEGKFFSAGGDLKSFASSENLSRLLHQVTVDLHNALIYLHRSCVPVVCAINGMAAGGGVGIALCGDYIIACESARFTMAYTNAGLSPDCSTSYFLPRLVGLRKAQDLLFNNTILSAQQALDIGLISKVVSDNELEVQAFAMAEKLVKGPTQSYQQVKNLLASSFDNSLEQHLHQEALAIAATAASPEGKEGVQAFLEKRPANFMKG